MIPYPNINPVLLKIGPLKIHWYGITYLVGFLCAWLLAKHRNKTTTKWSDKALSDLIFYGFLGAVLGGRVGYMLFYKSADLISEPWSLFKVWDGGMSFHGGLLGGMLAVWLYRKKLGVSFFTITDFVVPLAPLGLAAGRIGNFINNELWGRTTDVPWGMVFPGAGPLPRHPSQLYECLLEGVLLFIILWVYSAKPRPTMAVSGLFLLGYGAARCFVEFFRQPDEHLDFIAFDWVTMGHILSLPMIIIGLFLMIVAYRSNNETVS